MAFGFHRAVDCIGTILLWAILSSTVGIVLRTIERRVPLAGRIAVWLFGAAWGMTTYLVVPVLIVEDRGAVDSIRRSVQLLRDTWGPQLTAGIRFGWRFLLFVIPGIILGAIGANYLQHYQSRSFQRAPNTTPTSSAFGLITNQASTPQRIQIGARIVW